MDSIREQPVMHIPVRKEWIRTLEDSNPGHYGIIDSDVSIAKIISGLISDHTFTIRNVQFDFILQVLRVRMAVSSGVYQTCKRRRMVLFR